MAKAGQVRGMLLEEVIAYLVEISGYKRVALRPPHPRGIGLDSGGLTIQGRGTEHQID